MITTKSGKKLTGKALMDYRKKQKSVSIYNTPVKGITTKKSDTGVEQRFRTAYKPRVVTKPSEKEKKEKLDKLNANNPNYSGKDTNPYQTTASSGSGTSTSSTSDRAKALLAKQQDDLYKLGQDFAGDDNPIAESSLTGKIKDSIDKRKYQELLKQQQADRDYQASMQSKQNALDEASYGRFHSQATSAMGANRNAFAQGLNDPQSAGANMIVSEYNTEMGKRIGEANTRLQMAREQRARAKANLEKAQREGRENAVKNYARRLAAAENQVRKMDTEYLKEVNESQKNALDIQFKQAEANSKALEVFETMPMGGLADMAIEDISAMMGVDSVTASYMQSADKQRSTLDPNDPNYSMNMARINKATNEAKWAGMSQNVKDFTFYQDLLKTDPQQAKMFAEQAGIIDVPSVKEAFDMQYKTNKQAMDFYTKNGYFPPQGKYQTFVDPNTKTVSFNVKNGEIGGQCGRFGNDCIGIPSYFKDMLTDKTDKINTYQPAAGFAGVMDVGTENGHIFMVEKVNADGSLNIVQSNWNNDEKITRDTLIPGTAKYKSIVGFVNPAMIGSKNASNPLNLQMDMMLTQMRSGHITDSDISKARLLATKTGREDEFQQEVSNPKNKLLQENTANKFGVPTDLTRRELDQIVDKRTEAGYGNRKFQQVMFTANGQGNKELDNIRELYRMRRDLRLVDALQKGNGTLFHPNPKGGFADLSEEDKQYLQDYYGIKDEFWKGVETGPVEGRISALVSKTGYNDPSFLAIQSIMGKYTADYMKSISGAAISELEARRLSGLIPNINQQEAKFHSNLNTAKRELDFKLKTNAREWGFGDADNAIAKIDSIGMGALDDITDEVMKEARQFNFYGNSQQIEEDKKLYDSYVDDQIKYPDDL